ncbi:MAG: fatty acid--CoA ligase, partial [Minicystis sp.]
PAVAQAAVVGRPDARLGEVGAAFVILRSGAKAGEEEILTFCRERLANYKVPRQVVTVDELPMNATGKVLKYLLRERARAEPGG